jgi:hypothetical protein
MRSVCRRLDGKFLAQGESAYMKVITEGDQIQLHVSALTDGSPACSFSFPASDVIVLPLRNTTVEELSRHVCCAFLAELDTVSLARLNEVTVGVAETPDQEARFTVSLPSALAASGTET